MVEMNTGYAKSIPGILKIVEFCLLLLSFSCISDCCYGGYGYGTWRSRISFFLAVAVIGWLIVGAIFVFFFFKLTEKVPQVNFNLVVFITSIVFAVLLLISASLVAKIADDLNYGGKFRWAGWDTMVAGIAFGFFAMVAFIVDVVMHIGAIKGGGGGGGGDSAPKA
ncbi:uncharacterized protein LOC110248787 [Exaiptasia diaphana]|uniref:MARVEL domain-containing protein n=1 Tax=Exaiptasia diaphana TaxID=2652724 RepID=A0A913XWN7_EXADI|nr:uncharacterized protein LOC110248787 [Exaiptasia diaphana]